MKPVAVWRTEYIAASTPFVCTESMPLIAAVRLEYDSLVRRTAPLPDFRLKCQPSPDCHIVNLPAPAASPSASERSSDSDVAQPTAETEETERTKTVISELKIRMLMAAAST